MKNKNKKYSHLILIALTFVLMFTGCSVGNFKKEETSTSLSAKFDTITGEEAKNLMDTESNYIILDVRTQEEYNEGYIENAVLIPDTELKDRAEKELTDKNQLILVYCRSGRRSAISAQALCDLGYTNVKDFGGIIDWQYDIVK